MSQHPRPIQGHVPGYVPVGMTPTIRNMAPPLIYNPVPYGVMSIPSQNQFVTSPSVFPSQMQDSSSVRMNFNPGLQRVYVPFHQPAPPYRNVRQRAPVDPAKFMEEQRKLEKERHFQMQQQKLKQFTIAGKKGALNAESLLDSMFGKPEAKKNTSKLAEKDMSIRASPAVKIAPNVSKPLIPAPLFDRVETTAPTVLEDKLKEKDPKELENLMLRCSDFSGPLRAKSFQKPVAKKITKSSPTTFSASEKAVNWQRIQGLDNVFTLPKARFPGWCKKECVPPLFIQIQNLITKNGSQPQETSVLYPILLSSGLQQNTLGEIWELVNQTTPGCLTDEEMYAALALIALAQAGHSVKDLSILHQLPSCPVPHLQCFNPPSNATPALDTQNAQEEAVHDATGTSISPNIPHTPVDSVMNSASDFENWNPFPTLENDTKLQDIEDDFDDFKSATPMAINAPALVENPTASDEDFDDFKQAPSKVDLTALLDMPEIIERFPTSFCEEPIVSQPDLMLPEDKYNVLRMLQQDVSDSETSALTSAGKSPGYELSKNTGLFGNRKPLLSEENSNSPIPDDSESSMSPARNKKIGSDDDDDFGDFLDATDTPIASPSRVTFQAETQATFAADFANFSELKTDVVSPEIEISKPDFCGTSSDGLENFGQFASYHLPVQKPHAMQDYFFSCGKDNISLAESQSISSLELGTYDGAGHSGESKSSLSRQGSIPSLDLKIANLETTDIEDDFGDMQSVAFNAAPSPSPSVETNKSSEEKFYSAFSSLPPAPTLNVSLADKYSVIRSEMVINEDPHITDWSRCISGCLSILQNATRIFNQMSCSAVCNEVLNTEEGNNYIKNVIEVYKVVCRVSLASKSYEKQNEKLSKLIDDAKHAFNTLTVFMAGTSLLTDDFCLDFSPGILKPDIDSNEKACGVCLLNVDARSKAFNKSEDLAKLRYGRRQYHCACANLWVNCVDPLLPILTLPQLI